MSARRSWPSDDGSSGGYCSVEDVRLATGAFLTPGPSNVSAKSGLRPGPSNPGKVTASGSADGNVHIAAFQLFLQSGRSTAPGVYVCTLDASLTINVLGAHPADATFSRNDLIIVRQTDIFYGDTGTNCVVEQVAGTPSGTPTDPTVTAQGEYVVLARVRVTPNATQITTPNITDLRPSPLFTVTVGGMQPVANAAERDAITGLFDGLAVYRQDRDWVEVYDGSHFRVQGNPRVTSLSDLATITSPMPGQIACDYVNDVRYIYTAASTWKVLNQTGWTAYTCTWDADVSSPSKGSHGTLVAEYKYLDPDLIELKIRLVGGSNTSWGSGHYTFSLPFTTAVGTDPNIAGTALISGALYALTGWANTISVGQDALSMYVASASTAHLVAMTESVPDTITSGDVIQIHGIYRRS